MAQTTLFNLPPCCYRVSVKALIRDSQGRVLVVKEGDDYWDLPGGGTEHGEQVADSLRREVLEEVGLEIVVGGMYDCVKFTSLSGIEALFIVYECTVVDSNITLGDASESAWLLPAELTQWPLQLIDGLG